MGTDEYTAGGDLSRSFDIDMSLVTS